MSGSRLDPLIGAARMARGRADGILRFGNTENAFVASLAPLIAFPLVYAAILAVKEGLLTGIAMVLLTIVAQVAPPVLSHTVAVRWGKEQLWLRYATAYNWCYWAVPVVAMLLMVAVGAAMRSGVPAERGVQLFLLLLGGYALWLNWFVARHGLALSRLQAAVMVLVVNGGTVMLAAVPALITMALG